jgi:hypothetical protein
MAEPQQRIVCILGSSRSGTSVTARVLNLLGVYLGAPEALAGAVPRNPKGFWEHREMRRVSVRLLRAQGGTWAKPPRLRPGWERSPELQAVRERAHHVVRHDFASSPLWGWKDPRTSLTLPFWKEILPQMAYVVCLRNPTDVAASLEARNGYSRAKCFDLWLHYTAAAIVHTAGSARHFAFFEDYFDNPHGQIEALARFIGRPERINDSDIQELIKEWVDSALRHHRTAATSTIDSPEIPLNIKSLYLVLLSAYAGGESASSPDRHLSGDSVDDAINAYARTLLDGRTEVSHNDQGTTSSA